MDIDPAGFFIPMSEKLPVTIQSFDNTRHRAQVIALWQSVFGYQTAHNDPTLALDRKLAVADDLLFVALTAEKVIGTIMAGYDGHRGWLYSLAVLPEHRRAGIGAALVRYAEQTLLNRGCLKVNLQILESNATVAAFYQSLGYDIEPRISMGKRL